MDVVDADVISDVPNKTLAIRGPRRYDLVVTAIRDHQPAARRYSLVVLWFCLRTFPVDCLRGFAAWVRGWWRWMLLATATERAIAEGKASIGEDKRIAERKLRVLQSLIGGFFLACGVALFWWLAPVVYHRVALAVLAISLFATGHQWRRPPDEPTDERPPGWDGSKDSLLRALRAAKVLARDQHVWMAERPQQVGCGTQIVADLDGGVTWQHLLDKKVAVGSGLGVDSDFMIVEKGVHDGQVKLWFTTEDPFRSGPQRCPLLNVERWDAWDEAPFGRTAHGAEVLLKLMYSNYLGGGLPGAGKSFTARVVAAPFILDPDVRIFCANGKGDGAWEAIKTLSVDYIRGARSDDGWHLNAMLDKVLVEMYDRYDFTTANGASKILPEHGRPPWLVVIDELQQYTTLPDPTEETVWGKRKAPLGMLIASKLTDLAKLARASGIILAMLTQKPSDKSLPLELRDQISTRFSNRVGNHHVSAMVLGKTPADGVDASKLSQRHKGIGILVPDMEVAPFDGYPIVRPYLISDVEWEELGLRGQELRRAAGTAGWSRGSEADAYPLPELLAAILGEVGDRADGERMSSLELRMALAPGMNETSFGLQLRRWGCPSGRDSGNQGPRGPLVGDIRAAAQRIREGGATNVA